MHIQPRIPTPASSLVVDDVRAYEREAKIMVAVPKLTYIIASTI